MGTARIEHPSRARNVLLRVPAFLLLTVVLAGCFGQTDSSRQDEIYFAFGTVKDESGLPIEGATIVASGNYGTAETDEHGRWSLAGLNGGVVVTPSKDKWFFQPTQQLVHENSRQAHFTGLRAGSSFTIKTELIGPEHSYPIADAIVTVADQVAITGPDGRAFVHHLERDQQYEVTVATDFAVSSHTETLTENVPVPVEMSYPVDLDDEEFREGIFPEGILPDRTVNVRWPRGATIKVFFDYEDASGMNEADRTSAESLALETFQSWFRDAHGDNPYLRWGGKVNNEARADVIIRMMHDEAFYDTFSEARGTHDVAFISYFMLYNYVVMGEIWLRVDALDERTYARTFGRILGLGRLSGSGLNRSIMGDGDLEMPTDNDLLMLRIKMHLPAGIPYNP